MQTKAEAKGAAKQATDKGKAPANQNRPVRIRKPSVKGYGYYNNPATGE